jgi:hypothetical protein
LPFLPLFGFVSHVISLRMLNSSRFAGMDTLAFGVLGGKNGKKRQRSGKDCGKSGKDGWGGGGIQAARTAGAMGHGWLFASRYEVVKVLAARGGAT